MARGEEKFMSCCEKSGKGKAKRMTLGPCSFGPKSKFPLDRNTLYVESLSPTLDVDLVSLQFSTMILRPRNQETRCT